MYAEKNKEYLKPGIPPSPSSLLSPLIHPNSGRPRVFSTLSQARKMIALIENVSDDNMLRMRCDEDK